MTAHGFDPSIPVERAWTPPSEWYTGPDFAARERSAVFGPSWRFAARLEQLARPGDFVAGSSAGETWFTLRHPDGGLRAFHNVCRHHAAELCTGAGRLDCGPDGAGALVCPYHAWTYGFDGALRSAPELGAARDFERTDFALPQLAVEAPDGLGGPGAGLVFVNADPDAPPLEPRLAELTRRLAPFAADRDELTFVERQSYELHCNWKVFVDNYLDGGYHIAHLHHGLANELDLGAYRTEVFERLSIQSSAGSGADPRVGGGAVYAFVYPNFMLNRYGCWLDTNLILPLGPTRTRVVMDYWVERERAGDRDFLRASLAASRRIHDEDVGICESVQRGLGSSSYSRGRYAARELAMHAFHRELAADLSGGPAARR